MMKKKARKSQVEKIEAYLRTGRVLTPMRAIARWHCLRLGARIYDLRRRGMEIVNLNRPGLTARYKCKFMK